MKRTPTLQGKPRQSPPVPQEPPAPAEDLHPTLYAALDGILLAARMALHAETDLELSERLQGIAALADQATEAWHLERYVSEHPPV